MRDILGNVLAVLGLPLALYGGAVILTIWPGLAPPGLTEFLRAAPYLAAGAGAVICWRFKRSRAVFALALAAATCLVFREFFPAGPVQDARLRLLHAGWSALVPLNLAAFSLIGDRGVASPWGIVQGLGLLGQGAILGLFTCKAAMHAAIQTQTSRLATAPFLPAALDLLAPLPHLTSAAFLAGGGSLLWRAAEGAGPLDGAFLGALLSLAEAMRHPGDSTAASLHYTAACLTILAGLLQESWRMAFLDELTGIPGRRALLADVKRCSGRYAAAMVDVDHFKKFNDTYGHDVGDQVLRLVASRLAAVTGGGRGYRYGGEEFTVLFPGKDLDDALPHLEALRVSIEQAGFVVRDRADASPKGKSGKARSSAKKPSPAKTVSVTVSIGASVRDERRTSLDEVLKAADEALYKAKNGGRNQVAWK